MPPSRPPARSLLLSSYAYDLGVPLPEFLVRLGLCAADEAPAAIAAGAFRLDGQVLRDPGRVIRTRDLRAGSVAELFEQRVTLGFWSDEEPSSPPKPLSRALLLVRAVERWDDLNEYEGLCRAQWNGREYGFRVLLVGEEWDRLRIGATWEADVYFDCDSPVEVLDDAPSLTPSLQTVAGTRSRLCARILRQVEDQALVASPHALLVEYETCQRTGAAIEPGRWLRAQGTLEARMPD
jgi:hypothetical protein